MKLKPNKCEHLRLNALHRVHFENGEEISTTRIAAYLGSRVQHNGDHKCEIKTTLPSSQQ